jgi:hypothetical protein
MRELSETMMLMYPLSALFFPYSCVGLYVWVSWKYWWFDPCIWPFLLSDRLPYSIRILLESAIRNCDDFQVTGNDVEKILDWEKSAPKLVEIPFKPARVLLQVLIVQHLFNFSYSILSNFCG